jgi:exodeoxyribonuclease VII large subunit
MAEILSVTELTGLVKDLIEGSLPPVWVVGEVADLARPQSGHYYLTLKDAGAQIPAVIWRSTATRVRFRLHDGLEILCRGHLEVYAPRGRYQLIIEEVQPRGIGALELARRQLRERLAREGLFDPARKRPLPTFPRRIAVVTSPTGAALQDFLEILRRRFRGVDVLVVPCRVQGEGAAEEIAAAIALANRLTTPIDCLVVTRGGGSLEDLWAFNEEVVVRAICASRIPVVSGVGHEIDVTLADLAADVRALTPSDAAARVVPDAEEVVGQLQQVRGRLSGAMRSRFAAVRSRVEAVAGHRVFSRPLGWVRDFARRVDELESRLLPSVRRSVRQAGQAMEAVAGRLDSLSPLAVLGRGYSLTQRVDDGRVIRDAGDLSPGESIRTRFAKGEAISRVEGMKGWRGDGGTG